MKIITTILSKRNKIIKNNYTKKRTFIVLFFVLYFKINISISFLYFKDQMKYNILSK